MDRPRRHSILGITASAVCLTACSLLIWLWARSYSFKDIAFGPVTPTRIVAAESIRGRVNIQMYDSRGSAPWGVESWSRQTRQFGIDMPRGFLFGLPHWFLVLLAASLGIAPLTARWRFGPLAVLGTFTLVMVVWGLAVAVGR